MSCANRANGQCIVARILHSEAEEGKYSHFLYPKADFSEGGGGEISTKGDKSKRLKALPKLCRFGYQRQQLGTLHEKRHKQTYRP